MKTFGYQHNDAEAAEGAAQQYLDVVSETYCGGKKWATVFTLYDTLQPNPQLIVQFEPDDERLLSGEQGRAQEVVKQWLASHQVAA